MNEAVPFTDPPQVPEGLRDPGAFASGDRARHRAVRHVPHGHRRQVRQDEDPRADRRARSASCSPAPITTPGPPRRRSCSSTATARGASPTSIRRTIRAKANDRLTPHGVTSRMPCGTIGAWPDQSSSAARALRASRPRISSDRARRDERRAGRAGQSALAHLGQIDRGLSQLVARPRPGDDRVHEPQHRSHRGDRARRPATASTSTGAAMCSRPRTRERSRSCRRWRRRAEARGGGPARFHDTASSGYTPSPERGFDFPLTGADVITDASLIRRHFPYLAPETVAVAHARRAGWLSAQQLGMAMLEAARERGVKLLRGTVVGIDAARSRARGACRARRRAPRARSLASRARRGADAEGDGRSSSASICRSTPSATTRSASPTRRARCRARRR